MINISPKQAVEEYIGEQFIEWLTHFIPGEMQSWPIIQKIRTSQPKPEKIKKFMLQIFLSNEAFLGSREGDPGFLRFALANLSESDDPIAESALEILEARRTEEMAGHKLEKGIIHTPSRELWFRLLKAVGLPEEEIERSEPKEYTRNYIAELSEVYSTYDWQTAIGAFASQESAVVEEYKAILELLKNNLSLSDKDLQILTDRINSAHQRISQTNHILDKVVFDPETKQLVWQGIERQMQIRKEFLEGLEKYLED